MTVPHQPEADCALVELPASDFGDIAVAEKKYDTKTDGLVVAIGSPDKQYLVGRRVFFEEYRDSVRVEHDGTIYAFIRIEDIRGSLELK